MKEKIVSITDAGAGWIDITLQLKDRSFSLRGVSYTTDAIGDFVRFALHIATGSDRAIVSFDREPAEWRIDAQSLLDSSNGAGPVQISIYEFPNMSSDAPLSEGIMVFRADCSALDFSRAILDETKGFLKSGGDLWSDCPYPVAAVRALEAALASFGH